jgi:hypothetical protein
VRTKISISLYLNFSSGSSQEKQAQGLSSQSRDYLRESVVGGRSEP